MADMAPQEWPESATEDPHPQLDAHDYQHYFRHLESCVWSYEVAQIHVVWLPVDPCHCKSSFHEMRARG